MARRQWTKSDEKRFKTALVLFPENYPNRFEKIAEYMGITLEDVKYYYDAMVRDIKDLESGLVTINYPEKADGNGSGCCSSLHKERETKRGTPWSQEQHRLFLEGLAKCGEGNWKKISRDYVKTRSATQFASHAQKYFLRQKNG